MSSMRRFHVHEWITCLALITGACAERVVYEGPGVFALAAFPEIRDIQQGSSLQLIVTAVRGEGSTGAIQLTSEALPRGFSVEPGAIAAGYSTGVITLRADNALPGTQYRIPIVGRGDGAEAEQPVELFVTGKPGTVDLVLPRIGEMPIVGEPPLHDLLPLSPRGGLLLSAELAFYRYDASGLLDRSFGRNGLAYYRLGPYGEGRFPVELRPQVVGELADGMLIVAVGYAAEEGGSPAGILLFRITVDGALDGTYGPGGTSASVAIPHPGHQPISVKVLPGDELLLHVANSEGQTQMMRISSRGEVLGGSALLPEEGQLGAERRELVLQPDGKLVAAGPAKLVRFTADLQVDASFGRGGVLPTGTRPPFVAKLADGYLAAGATEAGPALWRFDAQWRPWPGFEGGLVIPGMTGHAVSAHAVDGGFNVAIASSRAQVVRVRSDGTIDPAFGKDGVLDLGPLSSDNLHIPNFETLHGRFYSVTVNSQLYQVTRYWGQ